MNTQETIDLVRLAAKAIDISIEADSGFADGTQLRCRSDGTRYFWNPLTNTADAMRLAGMRGMRIFHVEDHAFVTMGLRSVKEPHGNDEKAAVRMAITKLAAEYAKGLD